MILYHVNGDFLVLAELVRRFLTCRGRKEYQLTKLLLGGFLVRDKVLQMEQLVPSEGDRLQFEIQVSLQQCTPNLLFLFQKIL